MERNIGNLVSEPGPQRATPAARKCKSGDVYENARALSRLAKAACTDVSGLLSSAGFPGLMRWTQALRQLSWRQSGLCPVKRQEVTPSGDARTVLRSPESQRRGRDQMFAGGPRAAK